MESEIQSFLILISLPNLNKLHAEIGVPAKSSERNSRVRKAIGNSFLIPMQGVQTNKNEPIRSNPYGQNEKKVRYLFYNGSPRDLRRKVE